MRPQAQDVTRTTGSGRPHPATAPVAAAVLLWAGLHAATPAAPSAVGARPVELRVRTLATSQALPSNGRLGGVSVGPGGEIYVSNFGRTLWRVSPDGRVETLISSLQGSSGNAVDRRGNVYQASFVDGRIVRITPGGEISSYAAQGLDGPVGLAVDENGVLYVANCKGNTVSRIPPGGEAELFARSPDFDCPNGLALDGEGHLIVVSFNNGFVVRVSPDGEARRIAELPEGRNAHIAVARGTLYVTKIEANRIYSVDPEGRFAVFAGSGEPGLADGLLPSATLARPNGIALSSDGRVLWVNNLEGPWRGDEITRIVLRAVELPRDAGPD